MMIFVNEVTGQNSRPRVLLEPFVLLLAPYAPHLAEELWQRLAAGVDAPARGAGVALAYQPWPKWDPSLLVEDWLEIPVQVNGKLRAKIVVKATATPQELEALALQAEKVQPFLQGKTIKKVIVLPGKLVNIVV